MITPMQHKGLLFGIATVLLAQPIWAFTQMDTTRVLLLNDDTNDTWTVTGQGYINTNTTAATYWVHEGDPAPTTESGSPAPVVELALLDGTTHTFYQHIGDSVIPLWQLIDCRAGSAVATTNYVRRHFIPWSVTSVPRDGIGVSYETIQVTVTSNYVQRPRPAHWEYTYTTNILFDFTQIATVNMQNTTNSFVISPYYTDGIGAVYFDFVNGWSEDNASEIQVQIATNTNGRGSLPFAEETNYENLKWESCPFGFDVITVNNKTEQPSPQTGLTSFTLSAPNSNFRGDFFYRAHAYLNIHHPARFRIWRSKCKASDSRSDTDAYIIIDNIVASYPPVEVEIKPYGEYDPSRTGTSVLGMEGVFTVPFPFAGQKSVRPAAYYEGRFCPYAEPEMSEFSITTPRFYYRWRYLDQIIEFEDWKPITMFKSGTSKLISRAPSALDLSFGVGDIEFYYTATMNKAPHYVPFDFALWLTNPYGYDPTGNNTKWREDGSPWNLTFRRDQSNKILATQGTDWFVRLREGESDCEEVVIEMSKGEAGADAVLRETSSLQMELVEDHSWRAYIEVPRTDVGKTILMRLNVSTFTNATDGGYVRTRTYWIPSISTNNVPPLSVIAIECEESTRDGWGETLLDGTSGYLILEYNDETHAFTMTRGQYQNFNKWTDASRGTGYWGHSTDTNNSAMVGVSTDKKAYPETFARWEQVPSIRPSWVESFTVRIGDEGFPTNVPFATHRTPNGSETAGWMAENGMFVAESYSITDDANSVGMSLQMQGLGKGSLTYQESEPMPKGLDSVSFAARAAQSHDFKAFARFEDGSSFANYAVSAMATLTKEGKSAPGFSNKCTPSLSLVGYYRNDQGCYEFRLTSHQNSEQVEMALYRWEKGKSDPVLLAQLFTNQVDKATNLRPKSDSADSTKWTPVYLAIYSDNANNTTYITAAMANQPSDKSMSDSGANHNFIELNYADVDSSNNARRKKGTYGVASCDCPARFGAIEQYDVTLDTTTHRVIPNIAAGNKAPRDDTNMTVLADPESWALGRMEMITDAPVAWKWVYGVRASDPDQEVKLLLSPVGSGNAWFDSGYFTAITSFVFKAYSFCPRLIDDYNIRLCTGGGGVDDNVRTDVLIDDVQMSQWTTSSWDDWTINGYTNWVYSQCWIGDIASFSDSSAYTYESLDNSDEYVYVFTKSCTFTPNVDIDLTRALIVGGGGSGGATMGGGGGGGQVLEKDWTDSGFALRAGQKVTITVGGGGVAPTPRGTGTTATSQPAGVSGGNSEIKIQAGNTFTAYGGSGGKGWGAEGTAPAQRGSGGGGTGRNTGTYLNGVNGVSGNKGGNGANVSGGTGYGGGGGGAGGAGGDADKSAKVGGKGGDGIASDITGVTEYYGPGGGGGVRDASTSTGGAGGKCGAEADVGKWGKGADDQAKFGSANGAQPGRDGYGGGGGGGTYTANTPESKTQEGAGANGGSGVVILRLRAGGRIAKMQPRRSKPNDPVMIRSPFLKGMSLFSFSYQDADTNAVLRLQIATNDVGTGNFDTLSLRIDDPRWIDVTNFMFKADSTGKVETNGVRTCFLGLREPINGFVRLLCEPSVVQTTYTKAPYDYYSAHPEYGSITINKVIAYDEPILDETSWYGWNMRTTYDSPFAYLPDPATYPAGLSGALNFTAKYTDPDSRLSDLDAAQSGEYAEHDPFVQSPAITNSAGVGQVQFRARVVNPATNVHSYVSIYGSGDYQADDEDWVWLEDIEVSNRTYRTFQWKTMVDESPYKTIRLAVKGAKGGKDSADAVVRPIQRVLLDEISVTEPVVPSITFKSISPFRTDLNSSIVKPIVNASEMEQQPLLGESFGIQVEVVPSQLPDKIATNTIHVYMSYCVGGDHWGYLGEDGWANHVPAEQIQCELVRCVDTTNLVWRSAYAPGFENSVIPPQQDPGDGKGVVVQYYVWAKYDDTMGSPHTHVLKSSEWRNPSWYYPVDLNEDNGGYTDPDKYCPYTILQTISPKRSWINCFNLYDGVRSQTAAATNQFFELAVPAGIDMTGWYLRFTSQEAVKQKKYPGQSYTFATLGDTGIASEKATANIVNSYDFLTLQGPDTTASKGNAADGTWKSFGLDSNPIPGSFTYSECYAVEFIRPNKIIEHQIVIGGTNIYSEYTFGGDYDPAALREKLKDLPKPGANWVLAGADATDGTVGVMENHGAEDVDWEANLKQTPEKLNRRRDDTPQDIAADWFLPPNGTNYWVYSYIYGDYISQSVGGESGRVIRLIMPKGTSTNITYTVEPWHRIGTFLSNEVAVAVPPFNAGEYTYRISDISENLNIRATSCVNPYVNDHLIPTTDPYYNAAVRWLESFGEEREVIPAELQEKSRDYNGKHLSFKEMYWMDIYPFETNRLVIGFAEAPSPHFVSASDGHPALTNIRMSVYMMITNNDSRGTGKAYAPYTIQGLGGESSVDYTSASPNWTSATFKVIGKLHSYEDKWRSLRYFVFNTNSFENFTAKIELWDPYSKQSPISSDPDVEWEKFRGVPNADIWYMFRIDDEARPVRITPLKSTDYLTP